MTNITNTEQPPPPTTLQPSHSWVWGFRAHVNSEQ